MADGGSVYGITRYGSLNTQIQKLAHNRLHSKHTHTAARSPVTARASTLISRIAVSKCTDLAAIPLQSVSIIFD